MKTRYLSASWSIRSYRSPCSRIRSNWRWLKQNVAEQPSKPIYLGYGEKDPYVEGHQLLARILPPDRVYTVPGGHTYESFRGLWKMFLDQGGCRFEEAARQ